MIGRPWPWRRESVGAGADNREASGHHGAPVTSTATTPAPTNTGDVIRDAVTRMLADMKAWG